MRLISCYSDVVGFFVFLYNRKLCCILYIDSVRICWRNGSYKGDYWFWCLEECKYKKY